MFKSILLVQWKWSRWSVVLLALAIVTVPIWSLSGDLSSPLSSNGKTVLLSHMETASTWYATIAVVAGFLLAMHAWRTDHQGRNVYALSLPVARWRYALYRYGAGALCASLIIVAFWLAALAAVAINGVPVGLHAYPTGLAVRVLLVMLAAYAVFFALWSNTARAAYYIAGTVVLLFAALALSQALHSAFVLSALETLWQGVGLLEIFGGRWFLIDV